MPRMPRKFKDKVDDTPIPCRLASSFHTKTSLEASPDVKNERPLFSKDLEPPRGFGPLSTVCDKPRGRTPRDGVHNFIFAREKVAARPRTGRNNDDGTPVINDAINHPEFYGYYNFEGRKIDELTTFEKNALEMAVHYPNIRNGIMKAPLYFRTGSFTRPRADQPDLVRQVFGTTELFDKIVSHLIPRYGDLANLCATSQFLAGKIQSLWMHLDATDNSFLGWDMYSLDDVRKIEAQKEANCTQGVKQVHSRFFSPSVIISPVRPQDQGPSREVIFNKAGYPVTSSVEEYEETDFASSMMAHYKLLHLVYLNGSAIKHLILHSLPWLNTKALQRILPEMDVLEALGVHQCFLLTLGDTQPFLVAINDINENRAKLNRPHIAADFTPFYYKGPPYKPDGTGHVGEYGIVPEEKVWLDSTHAVTAQLLGIRDLCHKGYQDFFTPGTGFRSFLDRLPVRTMASILKCIEAIHDYKRNKHHSGVGVPHWCRTGTHYSHGHDKRPLISEEMKHAMEVTLWQDLIISCNGRPVLQKKLNDFIILRGKFKLTHCVECNTDMPACFFMANILARRAEYVLCHGCQLGIHLSKHNWRLYKERRDLAERIFKGRRSKELSLRKVLKNISKPERPWISASIPPRDAILSRPGMVDSDFHEKAEKLGWKLTIQIPRRLNLVHAAIEVIDKEYDDYLSYEDRIRKEGRQRELQLEELQLGFESGTNQHDQYNGSLERPCRSWELNMRDFRAELALDNGDFVNNAHIPIFNLESNVAAMLGRSGGLPEYWKDGPNKEFGNKDVVFKDPHNTTMSSVSTEIEPPKKESGLSSLKSNDWDEDNPVRPVASRPSSMTTLSTNSGHHFTAISGQEEANYQTSSITHEDTSEKATQPPRRLLPHQRRGPQTAQSTQSTPQQKPLTYASVAASANSPSHQVPKTPTPGRIRTPSLHEESAQEATPTESTPTPAPKPQPQPQPSPPRQRRYAPIIHDPHPYLDFHAMRMRAAGRWS
ncbi:hypothetical protein F5Y12DRAFT_712929 [Xylaria sp. FL1777]|nr:hypothetical protein F5Y12DRAFT_712929 [Xylaria sp. FL1777]